MKVLFSPQVNADKILYSFEKDIIHVTMGAITDTFDFSNFPDGELDTTDITTTLPIMPIASATRENGILSVQVVNFISENASHEERFPDWREL